MTSNYKQLISYVLKAAIVVLAFWFIYRKVSSNQNVDAFYNLSKKVSATEIAAVLSLVTFLMFINWGLEALKWRGLISKVEKISLWKSIESVFCGLTWAVFTPNRIGEYGGRVFFLSPKRRIMGVVVMAVGNIGQMVLTNVFGAISLCIFIYKFVEIDFRLFYALTILLCMFSLFWVLFYFNISWLKGILLSFSLTRKYKRFYGVLSRYHTKELFRILLYSFARYIIFSTQYFILFNWMIPEISGADVLMMVSILFLVQSALPSLDIFDIGVRGFTAAYFFSFVTDRELSVIASVAAIWLTNIIIPAILGSYFVFKLDFFGNSRNS